MVVPRLHPQRQVDPRLRARLRQQLRLQLLGKKLVRIALIDQQRRHPRAILDQRDRVMRAPARPVRAQIAAQRLLAPRHLRRRDDRRERRHRLEAIGKRQPDR
ncbi:hypothetical protein WR25_19838 [Diploscapter pachys]|uniref:Uncharacterized protein n=1 Tax=Diploscapter pachys TaxID=2018661 RepID=A0A2A2JXK4_9BILA|nr:hypothetical protein WR25_19838 [Diploscapter pachys]